MIKELVIWGLRGFGVEKRVKFAIPNGKAGSGITFLVGGNNTGKTTILEALRSFNCGQYDSLSFSERKRNKKSDDGKVHLKLIASENETYTIDTVSSGGSMTEIKRIPEKEEDWEPPQIFVLQSRRFVEYEFYKNDMDRYDYVRHLQINNNNRSHILNEFSARLFKMQSKKEEFDPIIKQILGYDLEWTIEQNDNSSYYIKLTTNGATYSNEGLGDGIWSVFTICDALYDSEPGSTIAIDEPELSLHPAYQRRVMELLKYYSQDRQIIINTHSPYFIDLDSIVNGAFLYRTIKTAEGDINLFQLSDKSSARIKGFINDIYQPHTLGTEAKEIFFLEDKVIVTEGQEDVIMYNKASSILDCPIKGSFFGWGSGGADKIRFILNILHDLGYKKVSVILDGDKSGEMEKLKSDYTDYDFHIISKDDIRDKDPVCKDAKEGLMTIKGEVKDECKDEIKHLISGINDYFSD